MAICGKIQDHFVNSSFKTEIKLVKLYYILLFSENSSLEKQFDPNLIILGKEIVDHGPLITLQEFAIFTR